MVPPKVAVAVLAPPLLTVTPNEADELAVIPIEVPTNSLSGALLGMFKVSD